MTDPTFDNDPSIQEAANKTGGGTETITEKTPDTFKDVLKELSRLTQDVATNVTKTNQNEQLVVFGFIVLLIMVATLVIDTFRNDNPPIINIYESKTEVSQPTPPMG